MSTDKKQSRPLLVVLGSIVMLAPGIGAQPRPEAPMTPGTACKYAVSAASPVFGIRGGDGLLSRETAPGCPSAVTGDMWINPDASASRAGSAVLPFTVGPSDTPRDGGLTAASPTAATTYLVTASERFQRTDGVYTDADAAGNEFAARGRIFSSGGENAVPPMDEVSSGAPCFDITCITARFLALGNNWGGWYFLTGTPTGSQVQPLPNSGDVANAGINLSGATKLQFMARGGKGGEKVEFFVFGVGRTDPPFMPSPDFSTRVSLGEITLSQTWQTYEIPLVGRDLNNAGGFGWVAAAASNQYRDITFYLDNIRYFRDHLSDPRFLVSYETQKSNNAFDKVNRNSAYLYDNAVALIGLAAAGDLVRARTIADAIVYAQQNDRFYTDGRVRNAYQGGDLIVPPGGTPNGKPGTVRMPGWHDAWRTTWFEDQTQVGTSTGNVAWAMLALLYFHEQTHEPQYLSSAMRMGDWILANTWDDRGSGGFTAGFEGSEPNSLQRMSKATGHNIDLYAAFRQLYLIDKVDKWNQAAQHAKTFFLSMWDEREGKFWTGTAEDGVTISKEVIPLDIQAWAIQALGGESQPYWRALEYVESHHGTAVGYGFKQNGGNSCGDETWFEGTAQVALSYKLIGNNARWQSLLDGIHSAQSNSGGIPATTGSCVNTGFLLSDGQPWVYLPRIHVGATAWLSLAESGVNPFATPQDSSLPPTVVIDLPASNSGVAGTVFITGWALDNASAVETAISKVEVFVDGAKVGNASYGLQRFDICNDLPGRPGCPNVGFIFQWNTIGFTPGTHTIVVQATDSDSTPKTGFSQPRIVTIGIGGLSPTVVIDTPMQNFNVSGTVLITGWALDNATAVETAISKVEVFVDGVKLGNATYGLPRPDVCAVVPGRPGCPNVGYSFQWNTDGLTNGTHTIVVQATDSDGTPKTSASQPLTVTVVNSAPTVIIDLPTNNSAVAGTVVISGWALDNIVAAETPISKVEVFVDGVKVGNATYGLPRPDVCAVVPGRPGCPNVGFSFQWNTAGLSAGNHTIVVQATDSDSTPKTRASQPLTVMVGIGLPPTVFVDTPLPNSFVPGTVLISGWSLDNLSAVETAISKVEVFVDGVKVGNATYGLPRPDVCAVLPGRPGCPNVGFSFQWNPAGFTDGAHTIVVQATDSDITPKTGASQALTVIVGHFAPNVVIDLPTSNSVVSGTVIISGWALDNFVAAETAISRVEVFVDGAKVGDATYGQARPDVCAALPGRPGCPNVGFSFQWNTAGLIPGAHTVVVQATDSDSTPKTGASPPLTVTVR